MARSSVIRRSGASGRARGERGAVAVEFALIVPMLLLLVFGIIEFGFMLNRDTIIGNASRDGARVASLNGTYDDIETAIKSELTATGIPASSSAVAIKIDCIQPGGAVCNANKSTYDGLVQSGATATVRVTYDYEWITPVISSMFGSTTTLEQYTQMRVE